MRSPWSSPTSSIPPVCVDPVGHGPKEALTTAGFDKELGNSNTGQRDFRQGNTN